MTQPVREISTAIGREVIHKFEVSNKMVKDNRVPKPP
jgi:hypothetical protein